MGLCIVNVQGVDTSFFRLASGQSSCVARSWSIGATGAHHLLGSPVSHFAADRTTAGGCQSIGKHLKTVWKEGKRSVAH